MPLFRWFRSSAVLGYLAAGVFAGPYVLELVTVQMAVSLKVVSSTATAIIALEDGDRAMMGGALRFLNRSETATTGPDGRFSARVTGSYRDKYFRGIPASIGSDVRANKANTFVDFSSSYNLNEHLSFILEVQNLTKERNTLYIDSVREDTLFQTEIGRTMTFGATYKF